MGDQEASTWPVGGLRRSRLTFGRPTAADLVALALLVVVLPMCVLLPWVGDQGLHQAVIRRIAADPLHPLDPLVASTSASPYYSPWTLAQGLLVDATGLTAHTVMSATAALSCLLLIDGIRRFTRSFTANRWSLALAPVLVVALWGPRLFAWSGYVELNSLTLTIAYPSTAAFALTLQLWSLLRAQSARDWQPLRGTALGLLLAAIILTHQFTGSFAALGAAAIMVPTLLRTSGVRARLRQCTGWASSLGVTVAALTLWPYYDFWSLASVTELESVHRALYADLLPRFGFLLLCLPALAARSRRDRLDPLVLLFSASAALFTLGDLTGHYSWGRIWPAVMLSAQIALAVELPELAAGRRRNLCLASIAAATGVGLWAQAGALGYLWPATVPALESAGVQQIRLWGSYGWLPAQAHPSDVILAKDQFALKMAPAYGYNTVAPAYPDFFLADSAERATATRAFFAASTDTLQAQAILRHYGVRWVIAKPGSLTPTDLALLHATACGPRGVELFEVLDPTAPKDPMTSSRR